MLSTSYIKKTIVYAFLCIYSFALLKPVMPVVNDVIAHTFYKMQHLATVHYENGKYHVHAELADDANRQTNDTKGTAPAGIYETLASHFNSDVLALNFIPVSATITITFPRLQHPLDAHIQNPTPPPEA